MSSIGERIKECRQISDLTLKEVAEKIGVQEATVQRYESGVIKNIPRDRIEALASVLNTTPAYLLCITDDPGQLNPRLSEVFRKRLNAEILNHDSADLEAQFGTAKPYEDVIEGTAPLTLGLACAIADKMRVSLDYLLGFTDDSLSRILGIPHFSVLPELDDLREELEEAEDELLAAVRRICGMSDFNISKDVASGRFMQIWNPKKIRKVMEFLLKNEEYLSPILDAMEKKKGSPADSQPSETPME